MGSILVFEVDHFGRRQSRVRNSCAVLTDSRLGVGVAIAGGTWGHRSLIIGVGKDDGCVGMEPASKSHS